jgi:hypothetical protein
MSKKSRFRANAVFIRSRGGDSYYIVRTGKNNLMVRVFESKTRESTDWLPAWASYPGGVMQMVWVDDSRKANTKIPSPLWYEHTGGIHRDFGVPIDQRSGEDDPKTSRKKMLKTERAFVRERERK